MDRLIDLENIAMAHPRWRWPPASAPAPEGDERPLLVVVRRRRRGVEGGAARLLEGKIAKWWTPDDVVFVDAIPLGATGKMQKNKLREQFADHKLPTA
jgi:fatty-acyl-CoA synthase